MVSADVARTSRIRSSRRLLDRSTSASNPSRIDRRNSLAVWFSTSQSSRCTCSDLRCRSASSASDMRIDSIDLLISRLRRLRSRAWSNRSTLSMVSKAPPVACAASPIRILSTRSRVRNESSGNFAS